MIYLTGDTHIHIDVSKLDTKHFTEGKQLTKDDYVVVLGDFGLYWQNNKTFQYWHKWFQEKSWTTLWIDGNHENFDWIDSMEVSEWNGGKVHKDGSIIHLMRGQVYEIEGKTFFTMGGADSIDKAQRTENISWWPQEILSHGDIEEGLRNLEKYGNSVDYVLTHTCPKELITKMFKVTPWPEYNNVERVLQEFADIVSFRHWYFGHWHEDQDYGNYSCLFDRVLKLEE